ncbi:winged helix DNA-binding domain-containing protein [Streptomyces sp. NBC_00847]|uniref:winged helix DNA-binding domain-containing protein n=1 Tax=unclassified Streptomyces TaxID=2593676 RepID=UPI002258CD13|nr:winged helix DNA-binding domain-containing protein [Streptomyces sp. NBC_00847]MCX4883316.1 winged helix DNA-binding domain-containing protein [Streptomyces sp. NBC_00847]
MTLQITWNEASARRLERQFLATSAGGGTPVAEVVGAMLGAHAQVLSAAEVSVGVRAEGVTRADVRAAVWGAPAPDSLVKMHGPRGTVHLLPARELPLWCSALPAVPSRASPSAPDVRVTEEQARQIVAAIGDALEGVCLTVDELSEEVVARTGSWAGDRVMPAFQDLWPRWRQVMHRAGQSGAMCSGPNRGRKVTYTRPPHFTPLPPEEALRELVRRYLHAYGPASPQNFAKWLAAPGGWTARLFAELAGSGEIEEVVFEGAEGCWVVAGDTEFPGGRVRGVRLLPYFDAYAIAAQPRRTLFPGAAHQRALAGGQAGNYPVLLVDGVVAGVWHQRRRGRRTTVTVEPLGRLTARQEREVGEQAQRVGEVLEAEAELVIGEVAAGPHA